MSIYKSYLWATKDKRIRKDRILESQLLRPFFFERFFFLLASPLLSQPSFLPLFQALFFLQGHERCQKCERSRFGNGVESLRASQAFPPLLRLLSSFQPGHLSGQPGLPARFHSIFSVFFSLISDDILSVFKFSEENCQKTIEFQGAWNQTQPVQNLGPVGEPVGLIQNPVKVRDASFYVHVGKSSRRAGSGCVFRCPEARPRSQAWSPRPSPLFVRPVQGCFYVGVGDIAEKERESQESDTRRMKPRGPANEN